MEIEIQFSREMAVMKFLKTNRRVNKTLQWKQVQAKT